MIKKVYKTVLLLAFFCVCSGCATLSDSSKPVTISSEPPDAEVVIDNQVRGKTPTTVHLDDTDSKVKVVRVRKEGYKTSEQNLTASIDNTYIILDILFGVVPLLIDASTGAWKKYTPRNLNFNLQKKRSTKNDKIDKAENDKKNSNNKIQSVFGSKENSNVTQKSDTDTSKTNTNKVGSVFGGKSQDGKEKFHIRLSIEDSSFKFFQEISNILVEEKDVNLSDKKLKNGVATFEIEPEISTSYLAKLIKDNVGDRAKVITVTDKKVKIVYQKD